MPDKEVMETMMMKEMTTRKMMKKVTMTKMKRRKKDSGSEDHPDISEETIMPPMKPLPLMLVPMVLMLAEMTEPTTVKEMMKEMMKAKVMTMKVKMTEKTKEKKDSGSEDLPDISEETIMPPMKPLPLMLVPMVLMLAEMTEPTTVKEMM